MTAPGPEAALQQQAAAYLDLAGLTWFHPANERRCSVQQGARLKRAGVKAGIPDVLIFDTAYDGDTGCRYHGLAVELKSPGAYPTQEQRVWMDCLRACGWAAVVCRSLDELAATVRRYYPQAAQRVDIGGGRGV